MEQKTTKTPINQKSEPSLYKAFISYSHEADKKLAPAVQSALHRFAKTWHRRRAMRVFRDDTNLSVSPGLWSSIESALSQSEYFLFFASPQAAISKWIRKELDYWIRNRPIDKLLIILTDGEIAWDISTNDFDWKKTTSLPDNLSHAFREQPLYMDLRWCQTDKDASLQNPLFRDRVADLVATIRACPKDELISEDLRQHKRFVIAARLVVIGLTVLSIALTLAVVIAFQKRNEAINQKEIAEQRKTEAHTRQLAAEATMLQNGESSLFERSILLALESVRKLPTVAGTKVLRNALEILPQPIVCIKHEEGKAQDVLDFAVSPDNQLLAAVISPTKIRVWRTSDWLEIANFDVARPGEHVVVRSLNFSPDGNYITMGGDGTIQPIWDLSAVEPVMENSDMRVRKAVFSPDGKYLVMGTMGGKLIIMSPSTWKEITTINFGEDIKSIDFSTDGRRLAVSGLHVEVFSVGSWKRIMHSSKFSTYVFKLQLDPKGKYLAVVNHGKTARIFNVESGNVIHRIDHSDNIWDIDFSSDGKYVATAAGDGSTAVWFVDTNRELRLPYETGVSRVSFCSKDNLRLITSCGKTARVWQLPMGVEIARITSDFSISAIAAFPEYDYVAIGSYENAAEVYRNTGARQFARFRHAEQVNAISLSPDNRYLVTACGNSFVVKHPPKGTSIRIFDLKNAKEVFYNKFTKNVELIRFSPNGKYLAAGSDEKIRVWSVPEWKEIVQLEHIKRYGTFFSNSIIFDIEFSPDSRYIATASMDKTARVWEIPSGKQIASFMHKSNVFSVDFSPNGKQLATGSLDGAARVWNLEDTLLLHIPIGEGIKKVMFVNDDNRLITASDDGIVRLWDLTNRQQKFRVIHKGLISDIALSGDSRYLATASWDRTVKIADLVVQRILATITFTEKVIDISFDSSGRQLATACNDGSVQIWSIPECIEIASFNHSESVSSITFTSDGRLLASAGDDKIARLWILSPKEIMEEVCSHLSRNMTLDEWNSYMGDEPYRKSCDNLPVHESFVNFGLELAKTNPLNIVTEHYRRVAELDPERQIDPEKVSRNTLANEWITRSLEAAELGQTEQALSALDKARNFSPEIANDAFNLNNLCWLCTTHDFSQEILSICDQAVSLAEGDLVPQCRDSRGIARALSGDFTGAIEDFKAYIQWTRKMDSQHTVISNWNRRERELRRAKREQWIQELETGRNPFEPSELEILRRE